MEFELKKCREYELAVLTPVSDVPRNKKVICTKCVFGVKSDGRFKARLVALVLRYTHGIIGCGNTFAPSGTFDN